MLAERQIYFIFTLQNWTDLTVRRIAAIFLLTMYLYDLGGYLGIRQYTGLYRSDRFYNEQTKKGLYDIFDVSEIKVPFNSAGITDWKYYRQISGQVRFRHSSYNYVALRKTRDTLYLLCLPHYEATHLLTHNIISVPSIKDIPVPKKEHVPYVGILLPPCSIFTFHYAAISPPVIGLIKNSTAYSYMLISRPINIPKQPPKLFC